MIISSICIFIYSIEIQNFYAIFVQFLQALGYHLIPSGSSEQGQVALVLNKKESEVTAHQQQIMDTLHKILGSKPSLNVCVEGLKSLPENRSVVIVLQKVSICLTTGELLYENRSLIVEQVIYCLRIGHLL